MGGEMEDLSYVRYTSKELLTVLADKIDRLDEKVDQLTLTHATLPTVFVTREEIERNRTDALQAKRWGVGALITSVGALASVGFLLVTVF